MKNKYYRVRIRRMNIGFTTVWSNRYLWEKGYHADMNWIVYRHGLPVQRTCTKIQAEKVLTRLLGGVK